MRRTAREDVAEVADTAQGDDDQGEALPHQVPSAEAYNDRFGYSSRANHRCAVGSDGTG